MHMIVLWLVVQRNRGTCCQAELGLQAPSADWLETLCMHCAVQARRCSALGKPHSIVCWAVRMHALGVQTANLLPCKHCLAISGHLFMGAFKEHASSFGSAGPEGTRSSKMVTNTYTGLEQHSA